MDQRPGVKGIERSSESSEISGGVYSAQPLGILTGRRKDSADSPRRASVCHCSDLTVATVLRLTEGRPRPKYKEAK